MVREWTDAERELAVNQRRLGFKLGRGSFTKTATISRSLLKGVDNFIQNDFDSCPCVYRKRIRVDEMGEFQPRLAR
jgi:hypothetical protein